MPLWSPFVYQEAHTWNNIHHGQFYQDFRAVIRGRYPYCRFSVICNDPLYGGAETLRRYPRCATVVAWYHTYRSTTRPKSDVSEGDGKRKYDCIREVGFFETRWDCSSLLALASWDKLWGLWAINDPHTYLGTQASDGVEKTLLWVKPIYTLKSSFVTDISVDLDMLAIHPAYQGIEASSTLPRWACRQADCDSVCLHRCKYRREVWFFRL